MHEYIKFTMECIDIDYYEAKQDNKGKVWFIQRANENFINELDELTSSELTFLQGYVSQLASAL